MHLGQPVRAVRLWAAAEAIREVAGIYLTPLARTRTNYDGHLAAARAQLGDSAFAKAWNEGRAMTLEQVVSYALKGDKRLDESFMPLPVTSRPHS